MSGVDVQSPGVCRSQLQLTWPVVGPAHLSAGESLSLNSSGLEESSNARVVSIAQPQPSWFNSTYASRTLAPAGISRSAQRQPPKEMKSSFGRPA